MWLADLHMTGKPFALLLLCSVTGISSPGLAAPRRTVAPAQAPGARQNATARVRRPRQDSAALSSWLRKRAETDLSCLNALPRWYSESHLRPWTASLPADSSKHFYRGATLTVEQMAEVMKKGFPYRKTGHDEVYFTARPEDALGYALPGPSKPPELRNGKFVVALFRVDGCKLPELGSAPDHRTAGYRKNVPASWFSGVWVLDPAAKNDARRLLRVDR